LVQFEFAGIVVDHSGDLGVFGSPPTVAVNNPITGRFSYMTGPGNPDQEPGDLQIGQYDLESFEIDQAIVSITPDLIGVQRVPGIPSIDPMIPPVPGFDAFTVVGRFPDGTLMRAVTLRLEAPYGAVFANDSLPTSLMLSAFTELQQVRSIRTIGLLGFPSQIDEGQLTSLVQVPEPGTASLALLAICGVRRRRRCE
jgi:hypothetical protein